MRSPTDIIILFTFAPFHVKLVKSQEVLNGLAIVLLINSRILEYNSPSPYNSFNDFISFTVGSPSTLGTRAVNILADTQPILRFLR